MNYTVKEMHALIQLQGWVIQDERVTGDGAFWIASKPYGADWRRRFASSVEVENASYARHLRSAFNKVQGYIAAGETGWISDEGE